MRILYLSSSPVLATWHAAGWGTHMREVVRGLETALGSGGPGGHPPSPDCAVGPGAKRRGTARRVVLPAGVVLVTGESRVTGALQTPAPGPLRRIVPRPARNLRREWLLLRHDREVLARAAAAAREFGPDVIYERTAILHLAGAHLARSLGVPLVVEQNSPQVEEQIALSGMALAPLARWMERRSYRAADAVVTVSSALKEYVVKMGAPPRSTYVVPNGARPDLFDPARADGAAIRRQLALPGEAIVAGFVGAFADWHRLECLIEAYSLAQQDIAIPFYLMLVGDGPHRPGLEAMVYDRRVQSRVIFTGPVPFERVPDYLAAMEIAVMPGSNWYGSPIKIFEYGAMGRAVIGPDTPPVREVMAPEEEGLIVPPGSVPALRAALVRLAGDPPLRERLGERFRARVLCEYTWDRIAERTLAICEEVLRRRREGSVARRESWLPEREA